jgi:hypothetical protein
MFKCKKLIIKISVGNILIFEADLKRLGWLKISQVVKKKNVL